MGIPTSDIVVDCLARAIGADPNSAVTGFETISTVRKKFGVNMTLGASNISFGMPDRHLINVAYLAMMITAVIPARSSMPPMSDSISWR
jgi:5-methyltetrahydrofolate--homocysteine methyltransferase